MKLNKQTLKRIIKEELSKTLRENWDDDNFDPNDDIIDDQERRSKESQYLDRVAAVSQGQHPFAFVDVQEETDYLDAIGAYQDLYDVAMEVLEFIDDTSFEENELVAFFSTMVLPKMSNPKFTKLMNRTDVEHYK